MSSPADLYDSASISSFEAELADITGDTSFADELGKSSDEEHGDEATSSEIEGEGAAQANDEESNDGIDGGEVANAVPVAAGVAAAGDVVETVAVLIFASGPVVNIARSQTGKHALRGMLHSQELANLVKILDGRADRHASPRRGQGADLALDVRHVPRYRHVDRCRRPLRPARLASNVLTTCSSTGPTCRRCRRYLRRRPWSSCG